MNLVPRGVDRALLLSVVSLVVLGVTMVYSAGGIYAADLHGDRLFFLQRQALFAGVGLAGMAVVARIPYQAYRRWTYPALGLVAVLLLAVLAFGTSAGGATRWLPLGPFQLQPSELAKPVLLVYLAYSLEKKQELIETFAVGILPHLVVVGTILALILVEPDFGTTMTIAAILFAMMFVAGTRPRHLLTLGAVGAPAAYFVLMGAEYRRKRMMAFWDPWADREGTGYQLIQSWLSFHGGGVTGLGLGNGLQKLHFLPAAHTDFIFAVIGEELGLAGVALVLGLFGTLVYRGARCASFAPDLFGRLLGTGITFMIGLQACFNMGVVTGMLPTKGLTLPFVSYGGSSLVFGLAMVGVLLNISAQASRRSATPKRESEARADHPDPEPVGA